MISSDDFKKLCLDEEWQRLEEFEQCNQGNDQLRTIRSRHSSRAISVMGNEMRVGVIAQNGNSGEHYVASN